MQRSARLCSVILTVAWTTFTLFAFIVTVLVLLLGLGAGRVIIG